MHPLPPALVLMVALAIAPGLRAQTGDAVTVYRCVDASGHVSIGDTPCPAGSTGQARSMQRPVDAPAPAVPAAPSGTAGEPAAAASPAVVVMRAPQPMYECVRPGGERYTSDTGDGNPRWVPLWTVGYAPSRLGGHAADRSGTPTRSAPPPLGGRVGAPPPQRPPIEVDRGGRRPYPPRSHAGYGGGTWVRDTCHALPQAEVCARIRDRREDIRRRFFNAQESERNELRREERGINARLAADCGIH